MNNQAEKIASELIRRLGNVPMTRQAHTQVEGIVRQYFKEITVVNDAVKQPEKAEQNGG